MARVRSLAVVCVWGLSGASCFVPSLRYKPPKVISSAVHNGNRNFKLLVGSQSTSSRDLPSFLSRKQKFREEKQKKLEQINHKIEAVEARRIGLAKQIALAELEQDRLKLEARRISLMESEDGSSNKDLLNMTEQAAAKVAAFLEESRKAVVAVEAEKCKLVNDAKNCVAEVDDSKGLSTLMGPTSIFGGLVFATVGLRMWLKSRDVESNDATPIENLSHTEISEPEQFSGMDTSQNVDNTINGDQSRHLDQVEPIRNTTEDININFLLNDLQDTFDEAIREATESSSKSSLGKNTAPSYGSSFSWEKEDASPLEKPPTTNNVDQATENRSTLKVNGAEDLIHSLENIENISTIEHLPTSEPSVNMRTRTEASPPSTGRTEEVRSNCNIKVIGVGDSGIYSICRIMNEPIPNNVEIWAVDSDMLPLRKSMARGAKALVLGRSITEGRGTDGFPEVGRFAAEESAKDIIELVEGADVSIFTCGLGSGTGSGAAPVLCRISKESGAMTVAIVTKPFPFEGRKCMRNADDALDRLKESADVVVVISNRNVLKIIPDDMSLEASFRVVDEIVNQVVSSIVEMLTKRGISTADFADISSVLRGGGVALVGMGTGSGTRAARDAAIAAMTSPLLDAPLDEARAILVNIVGGKALSLQKIDEALRVINNNAQQNANIVMSAHLNEELPDDSVSITLLATSFRSNLITRNIRDYIAESPA